MKTTIITGYKFIEENMKSRNGNKTWEVGKWYKHEGKIKLCESGFHACLKPLEALKDYCYGEKFFIIEARGKIIKKKDDKFVASEMRLVKEINKEYVFRRFTLFCAKSCLENYNKEYPNDNRISECIRISELYLDGKSTLEELSAAWSAAWSAAESAAWSAAESAARSAARSAAWSAARSAAWSAARSAADKLLIKMIKEYLKNGKNK
jgi:hypothetical protein